MGQHLQYKTDRPQIGAPDLTAFAQTVLLIVYDHLSWPLGWRNVHSQIRGGPDYYLIILNLQFAGIAVSMLQTFGKIQQLEQARVAAPDIDLFEY